MAALIDQYSKEELEEIVKNSLTINEVVDKLGYSTHSGSNSNTVKERLLKYNIDISHFTHKTPIKRTEENIFIENSTASQQTLRRWYQKGEYSEYKCSICGQEPIWQGKDLTLILDHINGNNKDHRLENLRWVCPNCNQQLDTTGHKKMRVGQLKKQDISKIKPKNYCVDCGIEISIAATRCKKCDCKNKTKKLEEMPITRDELKNLIRTTPFTTAGAMYGISDNAIRKWCDKFNLPHTKKEINSYSDKEWADI